MASLARMGQWGGCCNELHFGHVEFKVTVEHSGRNTLDWRVVEM